MLVLQPFRETCCRILSVGCFFLGKERLKHMPFERASSESSLVPRPGSFLFLHLGLIVIFWSLGRCPEGIFPQGSYRESKTRFSGFREVVSCN